MDYSKKYIDQISARIFLGFILVCISLAGTWYALDQWLKLEPLLVVVGLIIVALLSSLFATLALAHALNKPLAMIARVLAYKLQPKFSDQEPNFRHIGAGRELVTALAQQIYDLASLGPESPNTTKTPDGDFYHVLETVALPIVAIDTSGKVKYANRATREYLGISTDPTGQALVDVMNLSFPNEQTYEVWLTYCRENKVTDTHSWRRVRALLPDQKGTKQFDLAASFMKDATNNIETVIALFDQSERYSQDDQEISFVALAVHELRTPLTVMRGYIEVFEEELGPHLTPEMQTFMRKMNASAQQLTAFVSNILNVARVEENQLVLSLHEEQWEPILKAAVADLDLRARVHGKEIHLQIDPNLPTVAIDRVSIHEVINNLIENAIKYSGDSKDIEVMCRLNSEGLVETAVIDHGIGVPIGVLPHLFEKFYRSHRSKGSVGGTGLGLYLSKAIMNAHGGTLRVDTKEGVGSTFAFGLQQFSQVKDEAKAAGPDGIMRGAHGWIKNHNVYRR